MEGYNLFSRADMKNMIKSIAKQNYSNYKIVVAVDKNQDNSRENFKNIA